MEANKLRFFKAANRLFKVCKCHSLDADKVDRSQTAQLKVDSLTAAVVKLELVVQAR